MLASNLVSCGIHAPNLRSQTEEREQRAARLREMEIVELKRSLREKAMEEAMTSLTLVYNDRIQVVHSLRVFLIMVALLSVGSRISRDLLLRSTCASLLCLRRPRRREPPVAKEAD
jgi:hypothetical protein